MKKLLDVEIAKIYKNNSQKIRVMSESWTENNIFCPNCGKNNLKNLENNKKASDFLCKSCLENFEQKASKNEFKNKVLSSEYFTLIKRLKSTDNPNFFFLHYLQRDYFVNDFFVVPKYFFAPEIIEKRKPLSKKAKRAGWTGSNILFSKIPNSGKIYYIQDGNIVSKKQVLEKWQKTIFLKKIKKPELKGWILDIMNSVESLDKKEFKLSEIYKFEDNLRILHPENKNIKAKIRQQLQFLRDKNFIEFIGKGLYRLK